ncbi:MAG: sensor histidine kinase [Pseudonocardia sp.]
MADGAAVPAGHLRSRPLRRRLRGPIRETRRWPLSRLFAIAAAGTALLGLLAVVLGALALSRLSSARSAILDEVTPALVTGQQLSVDLLNQETGVRGFSLTRNEEFLGPYVMGQAARRQSSATLRTLSSAENLVDLDLNLDRVEQAVQRWRTDFAEPTIAAGRAAPGTTTAPDPEVGRALFTDVRLAVDAVLDDLRAAQVAARQRLEDASASLLAIAVAAAAAVGGFLLIVGTGLQLAVLRPVSLLAGQVREVVSGSVENEVRAGGPREIAGLGEDVEAMRRHILRELEVLRQTNQRLDDQARDLERSNRDLEQFAYVASHDLQEPLRKVSSFCQLLKRRYGGELDDRADQYIDFAVDGAQRMQRLINDLLTFSRIGRTSEGFQPIDLGAVAAAAAAQLEVVRAEVNGEIVIGELPDLLGDPTLLRQLLTNLIGNGLKFHRDGVEPVVRVSAEQAGEVWEIAVADNGIGIDPEYADKVFVIFQRLHGRDLYPGTGIGLALAKKIVEFHDGRIWLDTGSPGGPGTTIRFTLPATKSDHEETPSALH